MKKLILVILASFTLSTLNAQKPSGCEQFSVFDKNSTPDLGIVIYSNDAETVWNALRLATYSQGQGDTVAIFLLGKGLDGFQTKEPNFDMEEFKDTFIANGGQIIACASCAKIRGTEEIGSCTISGMKDLYWIIKRSKKIITF